MAGLIRGVVARRRRVHHSNTTSTNITSFLSSRRSAFSFFSNCSSAPSFLGQTRSRTYEDGELWKLGALAREAKERLDAKLRSQTATIIRNNTESEERTPNNSSTVVKQVLRREVFGRRKKHGKGGEKRRFIPKFGWNNWKTNTGKQQLEECAVCLNEFKVGDDILNLACAHTFHSSCLMPWLTTNAHCPCCRISIFFF